MIQIQVNGLDREHVAVLFGQVISFNHGSVLGLEKRMRVERIMRLSECLLPLPIDTSRLNGELNANIGFLSINYIRQRGSIDF